MASSPSSSSAAVASLLLMSSSSSSSIEENASRHRGDGKADDGLDASVCAICQHQPREPLVTQCRHLFCSRCIMALLDNASMRPIACPVCRRSIFSASELCSPTSSSSSSSRSHDQDDEISCTNQDTGCSWRGPSRSFEHHLSSSCMYHRCANRDRGGCVWVGSMGAALIHQATECESDHHSSSSSAHRDTSRADKAVRAILSSRVFAIDVGDRTFRATEQTLRSESGSVLDRMFSGEYELPRDSYHLGFAHLDRQDDLQSTKTTTNHTVTKMNDGRDRRVFIDCDPQSFEHALHWLRSYVLCFSLSLSLLVFLSTH